MNIIKNLEGHYFAGFVRAEPGNWIVDQAKNWKPRFVIDTGNFNNTCALVTDKNLEETLNDLKLTYGQDDLTIIKV